MQKVSKEFTVYRVRCVRSHLAHVLNHDGVVKHGSPQPEHQKGQGGEMVSNGFMIVRLVLDGPPPQPVPVGSTWQRIGTTASSTSPTYTPPERCVKHGHPPLRYLSNGGCAYCARSVKGARPRLKLQVPIECTTGLEATVVAMGWTLEPKRAIKHGRLLVGVRANVSEAEAVETCRGLGWEVVVWKESVKMG